MGPIGKSTSRQALGRSALSNDRVLEDAPSVARAPPFFVGTEMPNGMVLSAVVMVGMLPSVLYSAGRWMIGMQTSDSVRPPCVICGYPPATAHLRRPITATRPPSLASTYSGWPAARANGVAGALA